MSMGNEEENDEAWLPPVLVGGVTEGVGDTGSPPAKRDVGQLHREYSAKPGVRPGSFITVEASIAAGKTEFCYMLARYREGLGVKCDVLFEPVNDSGFLELLGLFATDPKRWAFTFQMFALVSRFRQHTYAAERALNGTDVVQDRSIYADGCFATVAFNNGNMTELEWRIYAETFGHMTRDMRYPDLMVFLEVPAETCFDRANRRARKEERESIKLEYFQQLEDQHIRLAATMADFTRVIRLKWDHFGGDIGAINDKVEAALGEPQRAFCKDWVRL